MILSLSNASDQEAPKVREAKRASVDSMLNDDSMAALGFLGIFMTRKVLGSLSEI